jgi:membrane protein required for colicin V production
LNWVTLLVLLTIVFLTWRAWKNGFIRELVSLAAVILAIPIAGIFYDDLYPKVEPIIDNQIGAALVSFLAILGGVIIGGQVAAYLLRRGVEILNLGGADQLAGAAFGFIKGILICQVILIAFVAFPRPNFRDDIDDSTAAQVLLDGTPFVLAILPGAFDRAIDAFLDGANALNDGIEGGEEEQE